jgi:hypothetical protein
MFSVNCYILDQLDITFKIRKCLFMEIAKTNKKTDYLKIKKNKIVQTNFIE